MDMPIGWKKIIAPPLLVMVRRTVLDRYFDDIIVEQLSQIRKDRIGSRTDSYALKVI